MILDKAKFCRCNELRTTHTVRMAITMKKIFTQEQLLGEVEKFRRYPYQLYDFIRFLFLILFSNKSILMIYN